MTKYFSGITVKGDRYTISVIDDNLNVIFMDNLNITEIIDLFKKKNISMVSIDAPAALYGKHSNSHGTGTSSKVFIRKRPFDSLLSSKRLFAYGNRFNIEHNYLQLVLNLTNELFNLGFAYKKPGETEKAVIEAYPELSFSILGYAANDHSKSRLDILKSRGVRFRDYIKRDSRDFSSDINSLCQAYTAYLYNKDDVSVLGSPDEGILVIPSKNVLGRGKAQREPKCQDIDDWKDKATRSIYKPPVQQVQDKLKNNKKIISEYCGAQYLYTNNDGVIRINELRPIKSYRPFAEIYEIKRIKQVQVVIGTTDGLKKVKANLVPNVEHIDSFKAAEDEDKKKLDNFWGDQGDKKGYLIKFNMVDVVKA